MGNRSTSEPRALGSRAENNIFSSVTLFKTLTPGRDTVKNAGSAFSCRAHVNMDTRHRGVRYFGPLVPAAVWFCRDDLLYQKHFTNEC